MDVDHAEPTKPHLGIKIKFPKILAEAVTSARGKLIYTADAAVAKGEYPITEGKEKVVPNIKTHITFSKLENLEPKTKGIKTPTKIAKKGTISDHIKVTKGRTDSKY